MLGKTMSFTVGRNVNGSVDGQHFGINAGQTVSYGISPDGVNVLYVDEDIPLAA
ncbi:hypothetical protein IPL68_06300 [Candidatus Saccharibacteria bacterium]|nr:MAG: hypothetical protein IPL68_06300 [Candidatus Saccharibacteria bacterium]